MKDRSSPTQRDPGEEEEEEEWVQVPIQEQLYRSCFRDDETDEKEER